jgi:protein phosphatase
MVTPARQNCNDDFRHDSSGWWTQLVGRLGSQLCAAPKARDDDDPSRTPPANDTPLHLRAGSRCVKGGYRKKNEDKCYADAKHGIFLVADGMGGYHGGAEASGFIVQTIPLVLQAAMESGRLDLPTMQTAAERSIEAARRRMIRFANRRPNYNHMGATMALVAIVGNVTYVARVGDCRVYLAHGGAIRRLTTDQSYAQALADAGILSDDDVRTSSYRHIVTNAVAIKEPEEPPVVLAVPLKFGDRLLLATDGLTSAMDDQTIAQMIVNGSPQEAADQLVLEALRRDSHDNITCVVVKVLPDRVHPNA